MTRDGHVRERCSLDAGTGSPLMRLASISAPKELVLNPFEPCPAVM